MRWLHGSGSCLLLALTHGCAPSAFDRDVRDESTDARSALPQGPGEDDLDGSVAAHDARTSIDMDGAADAETDVEGDADAGADADIDGAADAAVDARAPTPSEGGADGPGDAEADKPMETCPTVPHPLVVSRPALDLAHLAVPGVFTARVLGPSAWLGSGRTWVMQANGLSAGAPAGSPSNYPTLALDGPVEPWRRDSPLDAPLRLLEESTDVALGPAMFPLQAPTEPANVGLSPVSLIRRGDGAAGGVAYVLRNEGFTEPSQVWLAHVPDGATTAVPVLQPLFTEPPLFAHGAHRGIEYVKLFACSSSMGTPGMPSCVVGRVPLDSIENPAAYQVRSKNEAGDWIWSSDLKSGVPVLENVGSGLSVGWNAHLQSFLAVYSEPGNDAAVLRTAAMVEGPWSAPVYVPLPKPVELSNLFVRNHDSVAQDCGRRIIVSRYAPTARIETLPTAGDVVFSAIELE